MPFSTTDLTAIIAANPNKAPGTLAGSVVVQGIFTAASKNIQLFDGSVASTDPQFTMIHSEATANSITFDTGITINGTAYTVNDLNERPDGMITLSLTKA